MIRIGVLGLGRWGPHIVRCFQSIPDSQVVAVAERNPMRVSIVGQSWPQIRTHSEGEGLLDASDIDAVVIATPTSTHFDLARKALIAGKHVFVEKPLATNARQAEELASLAEETQLTLMVGHVFLYNPAVQKSAELIAADHLGAIRFITATRTNLGPIRADVNAAWDLAPHDISIANYWLSARPTRVSAVGGSWVTPGVQDAVFATLQYPKNVLVNLHVSWLNPKKAREIVAVGSERMLVFDDLHATEPLRIYDKKVEDITLDSETDLFAALRGAVREGDVWLPRTNVAEPLMMECTDFVGAITEGRPPVASAESGIAVVAAIEAIEESIAKSGQEIEVNYE